MILMESLIGSILANVLLLLGLSFLVGGLRRHEQYFNMTAARTSSVMLWLAPTSLSIATVFQQSSKISAEHTTAQSRVASIGLIVSYCLYLWFSLRTHYEVFAEEAQKVPERPREYVLAAGAVRRALGSPLGLVGIPGTDEQGESHNSLIARMFTSNLSDCQEVDDEEDPPLATLVAFMTFLISSILLYFCTDYIINSINTLIDDLGTSATFVGLILMPIPNCDAAPITVAVRDRLDATMELTVVKSIQTVLLVTPSIVLLAWWLGMEDMNLAFGVFETVIMVVTFILLNMIIRQGRSNW